MKTVYQIAIKDNKTDELVYIGTTIYQSSNVFNIIEDMNYDYEKNGENKTAYARKCTLLE